MFIESAFFKFLARFMAFWVCFTSVVYAVDPYSEASNLSNLVRPGSTVDIYQQAEEALPFPEATADVPQALNFSSNFDPGPGGQARIDECGSATLDPSNPAHMECFAVNTSTQANIDMSKGPAPTDPIYTQSRVIQQSPNSQLSTMGFGVTASPNACVAEDFERSTFRTETCNEGRIVDEAWCSYNLNVTVSSVNRSCTRPVGGSCSITPPAPIQVCTNTWQKPLETTCRMESPACTKTGTTCVGGYWDPIYETRNIVDPETGEVTGTEQVQVGETWVCTTEQDTYVCRTISSEAWVNNCGHLESNSRCDLENEPDPENPGLVPEAHCSDYGTRIINGRAITRCWSQSLPFGCITDRFEEGCGAMEALSCQQQGERTCAKTFPATKRGLDGVIIANPYAGQCETFARNYECPLDSASIPVENCSSQQVCVTDNSGVTNCWDSGYASNQEDFLQAAAAMEFAKEAGTYLNPDTFRLFSGSSERCRYRNKGISIKCCQSSGGAQSNNDVVSQFVSAATVSAVMTGIDYVWYKSAPYVYDFMYSSTQPFLSAVGMEGWISNSWTNVTFNPSFSFYGFTFAYNMPTIPLIGGAIPGTTTLATNIAGTNFNLYFNPYLFALMVLLYIYFELTACTESEQMLSMKKGAGLCTQVGRRCSGRILKTCRRNYCCYNSELAKIIGDAGRAQLGTGSSCAGLTPAQFQSLNFGAIDFSPFYADLMNSTGQPGADFARQRVIESMSGYE